MSFAKPRLRRETAFLLKFVLLVALFFGVIAPRPVNDGVVEPFTAVVARVGGAACHLFDRSVTTRGTLIESPRFAVNIRNGCNGVETLIIFAAAVLAFPAPAVSKLIGLVAGFVAIQLANVIRIVALFFTGLAWPRVFELSHAVVWPAALLLFGVGLFLLWAIRFGLRRQAPR